MKFETSARHASVARSDELARWTACAWCGTARRSSSSASTSPRSGGCDPTDDELSRRLNLFGEEFDKLKRDSVAVGTYSLTRKCFQSDGSKDVREIDVIKDESQRNPFTEIQRKDVKDLITKGLSRAERLIVILYYYEEMTMKEIGLPRWTCPSPASARCTPRSSPVSRPRCSTAPANLSRSSRLRGRIEHGFSSHGPRHCRGPCLFVRLVLGVHAAPRRHRHRLQPGRSGCTSRARGGPGRAPRNGHPVPIRGVCHRTGRPAGRGRSGRAVSERRCTPANAITPRSCSRGCTRSSVRRAATALLRTGGGVRARWTWTCCCTMGGDR